MATWTLFLQSWTWEQLSFNYVRIQVLQKDMMQWDKNICQYYNQCIYDFTVHKDDSIASGL